MINFLQKCLRFWNANKKWILQVLIILIIVFAIRFTICNYHCILKYFSNEYSSFAGSIVGVLVAGIIAYYVAKWQINRQTTLQREANRADQLFNIKRRFIEDFYNNYITLTTEINKPIQIQNQKLIYLKEYIKSSTIGGQKVSIERYVEDLKNEVGILKIIDSPAVQKAGTSISSLIECNRQIIPPRVVFDYLAYTNDVTLYDQLVNTWYSLSDYIIEHKTVHGINKLVTLHEDAIKDLHKKIAYNGWKLMSIFRPIQKDVFNQLLYGEKNDVAEELLKQAAEWLNIKQYDKSIEIIKESLKYNKSYKAFLYLGVAYSGKNEIDNSLTFINMALLMCPNNIYALENKAIVLTKKGDYKNASEVYKRRLSLDFEGYNAIPNLIELLIIENNRKEAQKYLSLSENIMPNNLFATSMLYMILKIVGGDLTGKIIDEIKILKDTNDWEFHTWSFTELKVWINDDKKTQHLTKAQKKHIKDLIVAIELEKNKLTI